MATDRPPAYFDAGLPLAQTPRELQVLHLLREHGVLTRADLAALLQTSASQVSRSTAPLIRRNVVSVERRLPLVEGRPAELLALAESSYFVVGLDIGGLAQDAVVATLSGTVVGAAHARGPLPDSRERVIHHITGLVSRAIESANVLLDQVLGVGVGVRAIIDPVSGVIASGPETPHWSPVWVDFDLRQELSTAFPGKALVIDDTVRALAAAEHHLGDARGIGDFVFVLADSGIGAALMIEGRPYIGPSHLAGEIGHITLDASGPLCSCGRRGCVEMYASTSAMIERAKAYDPAIRTIDDLISSADSGNAECHEILTVGGAALGRSIAILLNLLSPALVMISGRAAAASAYMQSARTTAKLESLPQPFQSARIVTTDMSADSGARGAAVLILNKLFRS